MSISELEAFFRDRQKTTVKFLHEQNGVTHEDDGALTFGGWGQGA